MIDQSPRDKCPCNNSIILPSAIRVLHIISGDLWAGAEVQAYTLITTLRTECDIFVILMNHGELEQRLKKEGISVYIIDEQKNSGFAIFLQLTRLIKMVRPDIIHTHRQKENILGSLANLAAHLLPLRRKKSLRTTHGAPEHRATGVKKIIIWLDRFCGKYLQDAIISVSDDLTQQLSLTYGPDNIYTIRNGVNQTNILATPAAPDIRSTAPADFHIGIIGRLEPVKRVDLFIEAAHRILTSHPRTNIQFHIIGDGSLAQSLKQLASSCGITNKVLFHGHRSDSIATIAALDMVVMCSDHEGTPMTALETLALGKPLIAHNVGGLREILSEHPTLLVDTHTADGYSNHILHHLQHPHQYSLKLHYTNTENARLTLNLYQQLLAK